MENLCLIDADSLIWSASYNRESIDEIREYLISKVSTILADTESNWYRIYIGGENNFRYHIRKDYKANRKDAEKPTLWSDTKRMLMSEFNAYVVHGAEVDDCVAATYKKCIDKGTYNPIIATIDKDYKIKPVKIYKWETHVKETVSMARTFDISEDEAMLNFAVMLVTGDRGDNILTCKGLGEKGALKRLTGKNKFGMMLEIARIYKQFYGSARWRARLTEVYMLINLIDDYKRIRTPKEFDFVL